MAGIETTRKKKQERRKRDSKGRSAARSAALRREAEYHQGLLYGPTEKRTSKGSGRRPKDGVRRVMHEARPVVTKDDACLVTLRAVPGLPSFRTPKPGEAIFRALHAAARRARFRVVHFVILSNHVHVLGEGDDTEAVSRGVQSFAGRIALRLNAIFGRRGKLWRDRYHLRVLRSPTETRNALAYVLLNLARHTGAPQRFTERNEATGAEELRADPYSSGSYFDGWRETIGVWKGLPPENPFSPPRSWLLRDGWRRARKGAISLSEVPGRS